MASCQHGIKKLFYSFTFFAVKKKVPLKHALTFFSDTLHTKFKRGFIHALERLNMKTSDFG